VAQDVARTRIVVEKDRLACQVQEQRQRDAPFNPRRLAFTTALLSSKMLSGVFRLFLFRLTPPSWKREHDLTRALHRDGNVSNPTWRRDSPLS